MATNVGLRSFSPVTNERQWQQDLGLVQRTLAGNEGARAEFASRMKCIPRFLNGINRDVHQFLAPEDLKDAGQEVARRVWRDRPRFTGRSRIETWIFPYTRHVFREFAAAQSKNGYRQGDHDAVYALPSEGPTVAEALDVRSEAARVRQAMQTMDQDLVVMIEEHLLLGYSFPTIAAERAMNLNTVKARYYRGLDALRKNLERSQRPAESRQEPPLKAPQERDR